MLTDNRYSLNQLLLPLGTAPLQLWHTNGLRMTLNNGEVLHFSTSGNPQYLGCYVKSDNQQVRNYNYKMRLAHLLEY